MGTSHSIVIIRGESPVERLARAGWTVGAVLHTRTSTPTGAPLTLAKAGDTLARPMLAPASVVTVSLARSAAPVAGAAAHEECPHCDGHFECVAKVDAPYCEAKAYDMIQHAPLEETEASFFARQPRVCAAHTGEAPLRVTFSPPDRSSATIVMERLACDLGTAFAEGELSNDDVLCIGSSVVSALQVYHRVVGRALCDVAPQNICLRATRRPFRPALIDFECDVPLEDPHPAGDWDGARREAYGPLRNHNGVEMPPSARDDLESLFFVLASLVLWERDDGGAPIGHRDTKPSSPEVRSAAGAEAPTSKVDERWAVWWAFALGNRLAGSQYRKGKLRAVEALQRRATAAGAGSPEARLAGYWAVMESIDARDAKAHSPSRMPYARLAKSLQDKGGDAP